MFKLLNNNISIISDASSLIDAAYIGLIVFFNEVFNVKPLIFSVFDMQSENRCSSNGVFCFFFTYFLYSTFF